MKKIILLLVLIQQVAICQFENSIFPNEPFTELSQIAVEGDYIYTAGDCNTALISSDAGQTWTTIGIEDRVRTVRILPGTNGSQAIYQYNDGVFVLDINTMEFTEISSSSLSLSSGTYVSIEVDDDKVFVISNQNVHKATIGEYDWTKIADFNFDNDAVVSTDVTQNFLHIATLNGLLIRVDLETGADEVMNDFTKRIYSFDMVTDDLGYLTVQSFTHPIKTTDGGLSYTNLENMPENIGVRGYGDDIIMTVNTNRMYVSTDGGQTSTYIPYPDDGTYDLIFTTFVSDDGVVYFAGRSSTLAKTEDFGASFINLNDYKRENLADIEIHSSGTGVAVGGYSTIIKTEDGGENWALIDLLGDDNSNYINSVEIVSKDKYLVAGSNSFSIIENDEVVNSVPRGIDNMIYNAEEGYIIGLQSSNSDYSIVKSTDDGMTWESKAFLPGYSYHISQAPGGKIYVPGLESVIYTSTDGGETWDIESFGNDLEIRSLSFYNENIGLGSTGLKLYMTTDGGETANLISSGYIIANMHFISEDHIVYTTANDAQTNIYESTDGGNSFQLIKSTCSESQNSYKNENDVIWFAQKGGHINKYNAGSTSVDDDLSNSFVSIYPNPTTLGQDIIIDLDDEVSEVILTSISGKVFRKMNPGVSNTISTLGMNTGMYTISVKTVKGELKYGKLVIVE